MLGHTTGIVQGCEFVENGGPGVVLTDWADVTLQENIIAENEWEGILYLEQSGGIALQNECSGNLVGILVADQDQPTLEANTCVDNEDVGIAFVDQGGGTVRHNECSGNKIGIYVEEAANPVLEDNDCHDNTEMDIGDLRE